MSSTHPPRGSARFCSPPVSLRPMRSLGMSGAQAQQPPASNCRRSRSPRQPTRTRPAPDRPTMKDRRRAASCRPLRRRPHAARHGDRLRRRSRKASAHGAGGTGGRQFTGIVGTASTVITAEEIAHSPSANAARDHRAGAGRAVDQSLFGGVNGAKTSVDLRGFGAFATANTLILINGRRLNDIDMAGVDLSTIPLQIRSSASKSPAATAARCSTATTRSAASSISS